MSYSSTILADLPGTGSYYKCDEASGNLADSGGAGITAAAQLTPTYQQSGPLSAGAGEATNYSIGLQAADGDKFTLGNNFVFGATTSFSAEAWVYLNSYQTNGGGIMGNDTAGDGWEFWSDGNSGNGNVLRMRRQHTSAGQDLISSQAVPLHTWAYVVATYDGTNMRIYYNATLVGGPTASAAAITAGTQVLQLGDTGLGTLHDGFIARPALYPSLALSQAQITAHYQAGTATPATQIIQVRSGLRLA